MKKLILILISLLPFLTGCKKEDLRTSAFDDTISFVMDSIHTQYTNGDHYTILASEVDTALLWMNFNFTDQQIDSYTFDIQTQSDVYWFSNFTTDMQFIQDHQFSSVHSIDGHTSVCEFIHIDDSVVWFKMTSQRQTDTITTIWYLKEYLQ